MGDRATNTNPRLANSGSVSFLSPPLRKAHLPLRPGGADIGEETQPRRTPLRRYAAVAAALALLSAVTIGVRYFPKTQPDTAILPPQPPATVPVVSDKPPEVPVRQEEPKANAPSTIAPLPDVTFEPETSETLRVTVPPLDPWKSVVAKVAPAVCLLVVETPEKDRSFPVGTAWRSARMCC